MRFLAGDEKRFFKFISDLNEKDRIAIVSHNDLDGLTSAAIASKVLGKLEILEFTGYHSGMIGEILPKLKKNKINKIFFLDLCLEKETTELLEISKFAEVVVLDHHLWNSDINSEKIIFLRTETRVPACYLCYYLFSKIQEIPELLVVLGLFSDLCFQYNKINADRLFVDYDLKKLEGDFVTMVNDFSSAIVYFEGKEKKLYDLLNKSKKFSDLDEVKNYAEKVNSELEKQTNLYEKDKEVHGDLILFYMKPKYRITSLLSTSVSMNNKDKILVIASQMKDSLKISMRMQTGRFNCSDLLKKATATIPGAIAGGHHRAAGAEFPVKYWKNFRENLIKVYGELK